MSPPNVSRSPLGCCDSAAKPSGPSSFRAACLIIASHLHPSLVIIHPSPLRTTTHLPCSLLLLCACACEVYDETRRRHFGLRLVFDSSRSFATGLFEAGLFSSPSCAQLSPVNSLAPVVLDETVDSDHRHYRLRTVLDCIPGLRGAVVVR